MRVNPSQVTVFAIILIPLAAIAVLAVFSPATLVRHLGGQRTSELRYGNSSCELLGYCYWSVPFGHGVNGGGSDEQPAHSWRLGELQARSESRADLDTGVLPNLPSRCLCLG